MLNALKNRDYRLLWSGQTISQLGDQFHLVALPWLVLSLTHDPMQLGFVLALAGIPRALLMLAGGVAADRYSPRKIMLASDIGRFVLTAGIVASIVTGTIQVWMVYVLALAFGIVSGFFMPAAEAALPRLVESDDLESGNALMMGAGQLAGFVGPAIAGVLIAVFGGASVGGTQTASLVGIAVAMAADSLSFALSAASLALVRPLPGLADRSKHPLESVVEGLRFAVSRPALLWLFGLIALANLFVVGPVFVGIPVLAQSRFAQGAAAFGFIISAHGLGNLVGMIAAAALPRPQGRLFGILGGSLFAGFGVVVGALAIVPSAWIAAVMMGVVGLGNGYMAINLMTTMQRMTPKALLGRVMSLVMLGSFGLTPISQALAGVALKSSVSLLFLVAGAGLLITGLVAFAQSGIWTIGEESGAAESPALLLESA